MKKIPQRWFRRVSNDMNALPDAIAYYMDELAPAQDDVEIKGNLLRANQAQPGLVAYYDAMHSDLDGMLGLMEKNLRIVRAQVMKDYADNPRTNVKLTTTDLKTLIDSDQRVIDADAMVGEVKYAYKLYSSLMNGLTARGHSLNHVSKLRVAGLEEVEV